MARVSGGSGSRRRRAASGTWARGRAAAASRTRRARPGRDPGGIAVAERPTRAVVAARALLSRRAARHRPAWRDENLAIPAGRPRRPGPVLLALGLSRRGPDSAAGTANRGVDDEVSSSTIADLGRHTRLYRRRTGRVGFDEQFWFSLHFRGELFELGRLQFNPYRLRTGPAGPLFWYDAASIERLGDGFRPGDPVLGVHIPESGPLTPAACDAAFQAASQFFAALFPTQTYRVATCTSWLLDDQLLEYLDSGYQYGPLPASIRPGARGSRRRRLAAQVRFPCRALSAGRARAPHPPRARDPQPPRRRSALAHETHRRRLRTAALRLEL